MKLERLFLLLSVAMLLASQPLAARAQAGGPASQSGALSSSAGDITDLEALVVSGAQPGPGMWKVRKGEHVLHILGTVTPLPRRMEWASDDVEAVIAGSGVVIAAPSVVVGTDVGLFRGLGLVPAMLRARNNPGKRSLRDVVSPQEYARWEVLKARYIGRDRGVEKRRPLLAAQALYEAALDRSGLREGGVVGPVVRRARKSADVPLVDTAVRLTVEDPRAVLRELGQGDLADRECFVRTMDRVENDLDNMRARANAWAIGDIDGLRALPHESHYESCQQALTGSAVARKLGIEDLPKRAAQLWLESVDKALDEHASSFAMLPMHQLLGDDGLLVELQARGYAIEAP